MSKRNNKNRNKGAAGNPPAQKAEFIAGSAFPPEGEERTGAAAAPGVAMPGTAMPGTAMPGAAPGEAMPGTAMPTAAPGTAMQGTAMNDADLQEDEGEPGEGKKRGFAAWWYLPASILFAILLVGAALFIVLRPGSGKPKAAGVIGAAVSPEKAEADVNEEKKGESWNEVNTEAVHKLTPEEIRPLASMAYSKYIESLSGGKKETGPYAMKAYDFEYEKDVYYCCYAVADFNGDGVDELMIYVESWDEGFRKGTEKGCEYRFYQYDPEKESVERMGTCRVPASHWKNMKEACPLVFRNNGYLTLNKEGTVFAGIRESWMEDVGLFEGTNYATQDIAFFRGCAVRLSSTGDNAVEAAILYKGDGMDYRFTFDKAHADAVLQRVGSGTVIAPEIHSFGQKLDPQLTKDQALQAVENYIFKQTSTMMDDIKKGYGYYCVAGELENGEYVVDARANNGTHIYYHVNADYGDVTAFEYDPKTMEKPQETDVMFNAVEFQGETELAKKKIQSWQQVYAQLVRYYHEILPNKESLGGIKGYLYDFDGNGVPELILETANDPAKSERKAYAFENDEVVEYKVNPGSYVKNELCGSKTLVILTELGQGAGVDVKVEIYGFLDGSLRLDRTYTITGNAVAEGTPSPAVSVARVDENRTASMQELTGDLGQYGIELEQSVQGTTCSYGLNNKEGRLQEPKWLALDGLLEGIWGE